MDAGALGRGQGHGLARTGAPQRPGHRFGDPHQIGFGEAVHVTVEGRLALDHPHADARLAAALRRLHAALVEGQRKALPILGVELRELAAVGEGAAEHAPGELGRHEAHGSSPSTIRTMLSDTSSAVSYPRASGCSSRA